MSDKTTKKPTNCGGEVPVNPVVRQSDDLFSFPASKKEGDKVCEIIHLALLTLEVRASTFEFIEGAVTILKSLGWTDAMIVEEFPAIEFASEIEPNICSPAEPNAQKTP